MTLANKIKNQLIGWQFRASVDDVCAANDIQRHHLRTLLELEGTSFNQIKREAQKQVARELYGTVSQEKLANALGFYGRYPHKTLYDWRQRNGFKH